MSAHYAAHPVSTTCRALEISLSGFYTWRSRRPSARSLEDARLAERIRAIYSASRGT